MQDEVDGPIQITGGATTVRWLLANGLMDELQLFVHPLVAGGSRQRLFEDDSPAHTLTLADTKILSTGVAYHVYRPAADSPA